eukprot:6214253-Pleurochrysis_carterae.AAC.1
MTACVATITAAKRSWALQQERRRGQRGERERTTQAQVNERGEQRPRHGGVRWGNKERARATAGMEPRRAVREALKCSYEEAWVPWTAMGRYRERTTTGGKRDQKKRNKKRSEHWRQGQEPKRIVRVTQTVDRKPAPSSRKESQSGVSATEAITQSTRVHTRPTVGENGSDAAGVAVRVRVRLCARVRASVRVRRRLCARRSTALSYESAFSSARIACAARRAAMGGRSSFPPRLSERKWEGGAGVDAWGKRGGTRDEHPRERYVWPGLCALRTDEDGVWAEGADADAVHHDADGGVVVGGDGGVGEARELRVRRERLEPLLRRRKQLGVRHRRRGHRVVGARARRNHVPKRTERLPAHERKAQLQPHALWRRGGEEGGRAQRGEKTERKGGGEAQMAGARAHFSGGEAMVATIVRPRPSLRLCASAISTDASASASVSDGRKEQQQARSVGGP